MFGKFLNKALFSSYPIKIC